MSGMTAIVLVRERFTAANTGCVTSLLQKIAADVTETRKGRTWTCVFNDSVVSLSVVDTATHDFAEELIDNNLEFEDVPEALVLSFPTHRDCDQENILLLSRHLAELMGGICCTSRS
jgi:hypothetical protein